MALKIPVQGGHIIICDVPFSKKISGTILSVRRLCRAGVVPLFSKLKLSLLLNHFVVVTTFVNNCWWLDIFQNKGTNVSVAVTPSSCLIEMNPISPSSSKSLSLREWHEWLGHACEKAVISFLKQHVPTFNTKQWQPFFCEIFARAKSMHHLARACTDILKEKPLGLLVLDIMGPFNTNAQGFRYILTVRDHVSTYSIVYPLKSRSEAPQAIISCITQLKVRLRLTPRALRMDKAREFTSSLKWGDMAHAMMTQSGMPTRFWHYTYTSACYIHNRIPNLRCANSLPYQELFGQTPVIATVYPFGAEAIVNLPANQQPHKLVPRGVPCKLLKPLMTGGYLADDNEAISSLPLAKDIVIPDHLSQAFSGSRKGDWTTVCLAELDQMKQRDVWEVVNKTPGMKTISHQWVFDIKCSIDGTVEKFKAQMVACGDCQRPGVDCTETGAYLYSPVEETVLIEPPTTFLPHLKGKVLRLKKAPYGMKQAGRFWWFFLSGTLERMGFAATEVDQSLYLFHNDQEVIAIWIDADDGVVTSNSLGAISRFKMVLFGELDIKWSDQLTHIVGLNCAFGEGEVTITQGHLTNGILEAYPRQIIKHYAPLPVLPAGSAIPNQDALDPTPYRSVVGSLASLVRGSRPDLAFAFNYLAQHSMKPTAKHWLLLDHVSDAGWGGDLECSQSSFILKLGDAPIRWSSKQQTVVALYTCAEEYVALSDLTQHLLQAINQLAQLAEKFTNMIFCDNQAEVQVSIDNHSRKHMRYLDRAFFSCMIRFASTESRSHG
ncbi:hypothetical protein O181_040206 [Austropuccinia psidii MF-1]|uniref:Reverse transcriptase Ty1/copia-type domain-containing protein n=1 Tax=Austropuccinia psidii MF-1 TaxID=1389203 RepID=A0A9Q3DAY9_9BASI|nr:hypothetical protein [Austropuccinia psidii MF-1]